MAKIKGIWKFHETVSITKDISQTVNYSFGVNAYHANQTSISVVTSNFRIMTEPAYSNVYFVDSGWSENNYRIFDFGTTEQEVSDEFAEWLFQNADIGKVAFPANDSNIKVLVKDSGITTLATAGTYCEADIDVDVMIQGGVDTSADTVTPETLLFGVTAHDANGNSIVGTIPTFDATIDPNAGILQEKTVTTNGDVLPDDGYVGLSKVSVNVPQQGYSMLDVVNKTITQLTASDLEGVTSIGWGTFAQCTNLTNVAFPSTLTDISSYAFYLCSALTSITIPKSVTYIGIDAFGRCASLESITVEDGNTYCRAVGNCLIYNKILQRGCKNSVIPNDTTLIDRIGPRAFDHVKGLPSIFTIPSNITYIGPEAFSYASGVDYFDFRSATSVCMLNESDPEGTFDTTEKFIVPDSLYNTWIATACWASYASRIVKASEYSA